MNSILIFAKAPVKGFVKTRLKRDSFLHDDEILRLYEAFLKDIISMAVKTISDNVYICFYPGEEEGAIKRIIEDVFPETIPKKLASFAQKGKDFDERFSNAVKDALRSADSVVVIGSDSPQIQPRTVDMAQEFLAKNEGMVIGPAKEGGVYLVGVSKPLDFTGVFTQGVELENLVFISDQLRMPLLLLDEHTDIDIAADLITFICNMSAMEYVARVGDFILPKNTIECIREMGLIVESKKAGERERRLGRIN